MLSVAECADMCNMLLLGCVQQPTKQVLKAVTTQDMLQEESETNRGTIDELMGQ